jgi:hypothetical protein
MHVLALLNEFLGHEMDEKEGGERNKHEKK